MIYELLFTPFFLYVSVYGGGPSNSDRYLYLNHEVVDSWMYLLCSFHWPFILLFYPLPRKTWVQVVQSHNNFDWVVANGPLLGCSHEPQQHFITLRALELG